MYLWNAVNDKTILGRFRKALTLTIRVHEIELTQPLLRIHRKKRWNMNQYLLSILSKYKFNLPLEY